MMSKEMSKIVRDSINDNRRILDALGEEKQITLTHHKEEDLIKQLLDLMPKSAAGKVALGALIAIIVVAVLKK